LKTTLFYDVIFENGGAEIFVSVNTRLCVNVASVKHLSHTWRNYGKTRMSENVEPDIEQTLPCQLLSRDVTKTDTVDSETKKSQMMGQCAM